MKISTHVLVKNEDRFLWYSVMSVIKYVDRIRIWDTGSTDNTLKIIDEIKKTDSAKKLDIFDYQKVKIGHFDESKMRNNMMNDSFTAVRQDMLEKTTAEWFLIVDGDEVWWDESIKNVTTKIRLDPEKYDSLVIPSTNLIGDMYHYQEAKAGRYHLAGRVGHYGLRGVRRGIKGLHAQGGHGIFGWSDNNNQRIEYHNIKKTLFLDSPYLHATHLKRSSTYDGDRRVFKRVKKNKHELGIPFSKDFYYPEVFFRDRPSIVPSVWEVPTISYKFRAFFETPLRKIYRRTLLPFKKHGY